MPPALALQNREDRRETILAIASDVFRETGYAAASMSMIAARLGGSKGTLYNYFKSKEALFEAHVQSQCARVWDAMFEWPEDPSSIAATLETIGRHYIEHVMSEDLIVNFRLMIAESQRTPELGRAFYEAGPAQGIRRVATLLDAAVDRGQLNCADTRAAARLFLNLCRGGMWMERLLNLAPPPTPSQASDHARASVRLFMANYGR